MVVEGFAHVRLVETLPHSLLSGLAQGNTPDVTWRTLTSTLDLDLLPFVRLVQFPLPDDRVLIPLDSIIGKAMLVPRGLQRFLVTLSNNVVEY